MDLVEFEKEKKNVTKIKDNMLVNMEMRNEVIQNIVPHRVVWGDIKRMFENMTGKTIRSSKIVLEYVPYMQNVNGSIVVNLYDMRHQNPKNKLMLHTSFPASKNQYLVLAPNAVFSAKQVTNKILLEILTDNVDVINSANFGRLKVKCNYTSQARATTGGVPSLSGVPALTYTRGDLLNADQLETLVQKNGFIGPPLTQGRNYVLSSDETNCKVTSGKSLVEPTRSKYVQRPTYEDESYPLA
ncbi:TPA_asm: P3 [Phellodendron betacytorhabdovirus 1]|nr:TPA_asm: P3 [Phellodendron betacytorhabdovirus 1]